MLVLVVAGGCAAPAVRPRRAWPEPQRTATYPLLDGATPLATVEQQSYLKDVQPHWRLHLAREPGPVDVTLRAVYLDWDHGAYIVGDGGVALRRTPRSAWLREDTGTHANLRALAVIENGPRDRAVFAVGDGGTIVRRDSDGRWTREPSGNTRDLYAVVPYWSRLFAAGDGGTLLERGRDGMWHPFPSRSDANLRALWVCNQHCGDSRNHGVTRQALYAVGDGGAIVNCELPDMREAPVCVRRPSPTREPLYAVLDELALGGNGNLLHAQGRDPFDWTLDPTGLGHDALRALAFNHWMPRTRDGFDPAIPRLAIAGDGGTLLLWPPGLGCGVDLDMAHAPRPVEWTLRNDLMSVDYEELEIYAVGAGGMIIHGVYEGLQIPAVVNL
jgi:hypothetical protein